MRSFLFAAALTCATLPAQADTLLTYIGAPFTSLQCSQACSYKRVKMTFRITGPLPQNGQLNMCYGINCTGSQPVVTYSDGETTLNDRNASRFEIIVNLTLDPSLTHVQSYFYSATQFSSKQDIFIIAQTLNTNQPDGIGGNLKQLDVSGQASRIGRWTIKSIVAQRGSQLSVGLTP